MDLSLPISYNSLSINTATQTAGGKPSAGYIVESFEPVPPDATGYIEKRALQDGLDASDVYLGGRLFRANVTVYGRTKGDFWDKAQDLFRTFSPRIAFEADSANKGFLPFDFYQPTADISTWPTSAYPSGIPLRYYLRPVVVPQYTVLRDRDGGIAAAGHSKTFSMTMLARDPRKYVQTEQSLSVTSSVATVTYRGDYPTFPIISFSLSATGHSAFTLTVDSRSLVINLTSLSSGTFTVNFADRTIIGAATGDSKYSLVTSTAAGFFAEIDVGSTYSRSNTTGISATTLTYREAFA